MIKIFNKSLIILSALLTISVTCFAVQTDRDDANAGNANTAQVTSVSKADGLIKTISKSYPADANDVLKIRNIFGKVTVNTWDKNEFKVDIQINVTSPNETIEKRYLDNINIKNSKTGNEVSFETVIAPITGKNKMTIDYTIYMPSKNALNIKNEFGIINLPDMQGKVEIVSSFGALIAKSLPNPGNSIHINNGNITSTIEYLKGTDLDVELSNIELNNADQVHASIRFGKTKIKHITTSARINLSYVNSFEVDDIDKNVRSLNIQASLTNIKLKFNDEFNGVYDVNTTSGNFKYSKSNSRGPAPGSNRGWNSSNSYSGAIGKGDPDKVVNINSSIGNVTFD